MAKRKVVQEEIETPEIPEPRPTPERPCATCGGDGLILVDWDEDGNDILGPCPTCGGTAE